MSDFFDLTICETVPLKEISPPVAPVGGQLNDLVRRANDLLVVFDYADAVSRIGKRLSTPMSFSRLDREGLSLAHRVQRVSVREEPRQVVKLTLWVSPPLRLRAGRSRVR